MSRPALIAHRGDAARYPENTLPALAAAVAAGAPCIEFDLQLTADGEVVLLHDASLRRTAGVDLDIRDITLASARAHSVGEPARFGDAHGHVQIPTLAQTVTEMQRWPGVTAFVEIKEESTDRFGVEHVTRKVMDLLPPVLDRCVLISFSAEVVRVARGMGAKAIGWCFEHGDAATRDTALALKADVLLTDWRAMPADGLWPGEWRWALWEVIDPGVAIDLHTRGAHYIETMAATDMLADARLNPRGVTD